MKKTIYKNVNKHFEDALYWIENKHLPQAQEAIQTILDNLWSLLQFLDSESAFYNYIGRKIAEINIANKTPDEWLNCYYMKGFYTGK